MRKTTKLKKLKVKPNIFAGVFQGIKERKVEGIDKYIEAFGNITETCTKLDIDRTTFYDWLKQDKTFADKIKEADSIIEDNVEMMFIEQDLLTRWDARRYWLDRRHEKYKPKADIAISPKFIYEEGDFPELGTLVE